MKLAPVYVPAKNDEAPEPIIIPVGGRRYDHEAEEWVDETIDVEFRPHTALGAQLDLILDGTASAVFAYLRQSLTSAGEKAWETIETDPDLEVNAETLAQVCIVLARAQSGRPTNGSSGSSAGRSRTKRTSRAASSARRDDDSESSSSD